MVHKPRKKKHRPPKPAHIDLVDSSKDGPIRFSIIASAIRTYNFPTMYNALSKTKHNFEMVFAGDRGPVLGMDFRNFKYLYEEGSGAKCVELCARVARGKYLIYVGDDYDIPLNFLDIIAKHQDGLYAEDSLFSFRYTRDGEEQPGCFTFDPSQPNSPMVGTCGVYDREKWLELGGVDKRFEMALLDLDILMRFFAVGYRLAIIPDFPLNEKRRQYTRTNYGLSTMAQGRELLKRFWEKDGELVKERQELVMSYTDRELGLEEGGNHQIKKVKK